jgi:hypothetical protein
VVTVSIDAFKSKNEIFCDGEVAFPAKQITTQKALENAAQIANGQLTTPQPKPAPLYVRAPDAALPANPSPKLLP